jgi:hypothetical protein
VLCLVGPFLLLMRYGREITAVFMRVFTEHPCA